MTPSGVVLIDKPAGWTSHDVVAKLRGILGTRKIGHAGTLDPMATGLLTIGVGYSTRLLTHMVGLDKTYRAVIRLGASTLSDDKDSETTSVADPVILDGLSEAQILQSIQKLRGEIDQVPSSVSAIKVAGKRAYDLVREGTEVQLKSRRVMIHNFDVLSMTKTETEDKTPVIDLEVLVECSSGTYIRALARDLGADLGVGGHLTYLRRTKVGPLTLDGTENPVSTMADPETGAPEMFVLPAVNIARQLFETLDLSHEQATDLRHGKRIEVAMPDTKLIATIDPDNTLVGLAEVRRGVVRVLSNFPTEENN